MQQHTQHYTQHSGTAEHHTPAGLIALAWAAVMIPLAWGFIMTLIEASKLFY
jgi:hypothetical protein